MALISDAGPLYGQQWTHFLLGELKARDWEAPRVIFGISYSLTARNEVAE